MRKSLFAGLTILEPGESLSSDNGAFTGVDRERADRLLEIGAKTHRHNGLAGLTNPSVAASGAVVGSGGLIGAELGISIGYTLVDADGGETMISPLAAVSTGAALPEPSHAPSAQVSHASGVLPVNTYFYCFTYVDGEGGETLASPAVNAERQPGFEAGQVLISALSVGAPAGAVGWRLYRAIGGGTFDLLASGEVLEDAYADLGIDSPNCDIHPPLEATTAGLNTLLVTLPSSGLQGAPFINVYGSVTGDLSGGSFLGQYPLSSAGQTAVFRKLEPDAASPPPVNLSIGGADQIDPDTDILDWHWKRPVLSSGALGSGGKGDVRLSTDSGRLYAVLAASASAAPGWVEIASAGTGGGGASGAPGRPAGTRYKWSTSVEPSDPGTGKLRADNATFGSITFLLLSETDLDGNAVPISTWDDSTSSVRGTIEVRKVSNGSVFRQFNITGGRVDNGAWDALPVSPVAGNGTLNDGDEVIINVTRTGDKGDTGSTGSTGATGASGAEGPAGVPVVLAGGNPGSSTGTKSVSATELEGTNTGAIGTAGAIDGVTVKAGDWIFVFTGSKNDGVWEVISAGGVGVRWVLRRPNGLNTSGRVERTMFWVKEGSTENQAGKVFYCASTGITLGTTELVFRRLWNSGLVEPEFAGGTVKSSVVTVNHGLGVVPGNIELTVLRSEAGEVLMVPHIISGSENSTSFKVGVLGSSAFGAGVKAPVKWRAER